MQDLSSGKVLRMVIKKPESKSQTKGEAPNLLRQIQKRKEEFGLWAVSKILWATHHTAACTLPHNFQACRQPLIKELKE